MTYLFHIFLVTILFLGTVIAGEEVAFRARGQPIGFHAVQPPISLVSAPIRPRRRSFAARPLLVLTKDTQTNLRGSPANFALRSKIHIESVIVPGKIKQRHRYAGLHTSIWRLRGGW